VGDLDLEMMGPRDFQHLERMLDRITLKKLLRQIHTIHPRALEWFEFQLEGRSNKELAELWGVTEPRVHQLIQRFLPEVRALITDVVEEEAV
jgi:DNA-directed RNA polymerase specialized sigma24 family protein